MFSSWPIRRKLILGVTLLLVTVVALAVSSFVGVYAYRGLAKSVSLRAPELPVASRLAANVSKLSVTFDLYNESRTRSEFTWHDSPVQGMLNFEYGTHLSEVRASFNDYRNLLENNRNSDHYGRIGDRAEEQKVVDEFERQLAEMESMGDELGAFEASLLETSLPELNRLAIELPKHLHSRMQTFSDQVKGKYRFWIIVTWSIAILSTCLLMLSMRLFYAWVFRPLQILVHGSRRVAAGDFGHRIQLGSRDEIAELADAMNKMTSRFQEIRDDLDRQVQQRTKEVVRSEQLASVGFLAAGVAHEINNPLASIALCSESLEERLAGIIAKDDDKLDSEHDEEIGVLRTYLKMIQDEAFRCKEITERLLDFSRLGDVEKQRTDLTELTQGVIEMVGHLGKYKEKTIDFSPQNSVEAPVNQQEMKQVILNLVTNALDSLDPGGQVMISLDAYQRHARLIVQDNGCGMTTEVQKHLFEPFFTRRRDGQGTGLGMSITYRIIADHGGEIEAYSDGPGKGARFTVTIPMRNHDQARNQSHAA
jgi:signal transduction histidine kinase